MASVTFRNSMIAITLIKSFTLILFSGSLVKLALNIFRNHASTTGGWINRERPRIASSTISNRPLRIFLRIWHSSYAGHWRYFDTNWWISWTYHMALFQYLLLDSLVQLQDFLCYSIAQLAQCSIWRACCNAIRQVLVTYQNTTPTNFVKFHIIWHSCFAHNNLSLGENLLGQWIFQSFVGAGSTMLPLKKEP